MTALQECCVWETVHNDLALLLAVVESALAEMTAIATQEPAQSPEPNDFSGTTFVILGTL
jgi:hypothetical protein